MNVAVLGVLGAENGLAVALDKVSLKRGVCAVDESNYYPARLGERGLSYENEVAVVNACAGHRVTLRAQKVAVTEEPLLRKRNVPLDKLGMLLGRAAGDAAEDRHTAVCGAHLFLPLNGERILSAVNDNAAVAKRHKITVTDRVRHPHMLNDLTELRRDAVEKQLSNEVFTVRVREIQSEIPGLGQAEIAVVCDQEETFCLTVGYQEVGE